MRKIYLIRHGETDLNKKRAFYGSLDVAINQRGKEQAQLLRTLLEGKQITEVYRSDMLRTKMTADIIFPDINKKIDSRLNEKGFGKWEGLVADEIESLYPKDWANWLDEPLSYTPCEAENFTVFQNRVLNSVEDILKKSVGDVAIVCHLGVIRVIAQAYNNESFWSIDVSQQSWLELCL